MDEIGKEAIPSSKLKMKYEEFLQRALVDESYDEIKKISDVLIKIKQYENGKKVTLKMNIGIKNSKEIFNQILLNQVFLKSYIYQQALLKPTNLAH